MAKYRLLKIQTECLDADKSQESIFFHDLINHTHSLILFLAQKRALEKSIDQKEIMMIEQEIRLIQNLLKNRFNIKHKNLDEDSRDLDLFSAILLIDSLIKMYLPSNFYKTEVQYGFNFYTVINSSKKNEYFLNSASFHRIMGNLIKNISETKNHEVNVFIDIYQDQLSIETSNFNVDSNARNKAKSGYGIASINSLASRMGGKYEFESNGNLWLNRLILPLQHFGFKVLIAS